MKTFLRCPAVLLVISFLTFLGIVGAFNATHHTEVMQIEKFELFGDGRIESYVASLPNMHYAEVIVNSYHYVCTVPSDAQAGQQVKVYKLSTKWGQPIFIATYPPKE